MAFNSIPASRIVDVVPSAIGAGGNPLEMATLLINSASPNTPMTVGAMQFGSADEVRSFYGPASAEYQFAQRYFSGYNGATRTPGHIIILSHSDEATPAVLLGASMSGRPVSSIAIDGNIEISVNGVIQTAEIDLSSVTSFSQAATVLADDLDDVNVQFFASSQRFQVTTESTGENALISFASGDLAEALGLTESEGAQASIGLEALTPDEAMAYATTQTQNFAVITFLDELESDAKQSAARWVSLSGSRFMAVIQDTSGSAIVANNPASFGAWLSETEQDGTVAYYGEIENIAALCGGIAAIDFSRTNGRRNIMFMSQAGLEADVTRETDYTALISNGYTFYAAFGTANDRFTFQTNGAVSGQFRWADNYVNQIYLKSQLQLALMTMLSSYGAIPYNEAGKAYHRSAVQDPINEMLNFGGIVALEDINALSQQQKSLINSQAGRDVVPDLISKGYVIVIETATAQVRANRGSMPFTLWYTDGGSVQAVSLASVNVQ